MHGRGPPQSACPTHAGNLVLKPRRKQVFSGSDGGLVMQRNMNICGVCAWCHSLVSPQVQRWPCGYCPSIQSRSPFDVPCHCSVTQPNTCIHSLASIYSCGHSPFLMRTSSWMVWAGSCQPTLLVWRCFIQSWQNGRSGCQESRVRWRQNEDNLPHWAGAVNMVLLIQPSSAAAEWVFSQAYPGRAAFSGQQQAAFKIMWRPAWCFTSLIAETITLMCSSSLHIIISKLEHIKHQPSSHNLTNDTQHQAAHSWLNKHHPWRAYFLYNFKSQCRGLKLISSLKPSFKLWNCEHF